MNEQTWQCHECALACITERAGFISMAFECVNKEALLDAQGQYWQITSCQSHWTPLGANIFSCKKCAYPYLFRKRYVCNVCNTHRTTYISPLNMLTAFWAITCLQPPMTIPVSSKFAIVLEAALAAFHLVVPHIPLSSQLLCYSNCN